MFVFGFEQQLQMKQEILNLRSLEEELIASNIANVNTKNYKSRHINFTNELNKIKLKNSTKEMFLESKKTSDKHFSFNIQNNMVQPSIYTSNSNVDQNGNTVNMNQERMKFVKNSLKYQEEIALLNKEIKNINLVI